MNIKTKRILGLVAFFLVLGVASGIVLSQFFATGNARPNDEANLTAYLNELDSRLQNLSPMDQAFVLVAKRVTPAVVTIHSEKVVSREMNIPRGMPEEFRRFFDDNLFGNRGGEQRAMGLGSGVIVGSDGVILTNNHVVEQAETVQVTLSDRRTMDAKVIGADPLSDLAVLRIEAKNLPTVSIGDSDALEVGQWVVAIGNPFSESLRHTVTAGIVSAKGRNSITSSGGFQDFIQTDAAINPGNSGGALVNLKGELVGLNTAIVSQTGTYNGVGFAVPSNLAKRIMNQLLEHGKIVRGYLGILPQDMNSDLARGFKFDKPKGAIVSDVIKGTPAEKAGLKVGDVIIAIDGEEIASAQDLRNKIGLVTPGKSVELKFLRGNKEMTTQVALVEREEDVSGDSTTSSEPGGKESTMGHIGLEVGPINSELKEKLGVNEGVLVTNVQPGSAAAKAGLVQGVVIVITQVNHKPVRNVREFSEAISAAKPGDVVLLYGKFADSQGNVGGNFFALEIPEAK